MAATVQQVKIEGQLRVAKLRQDAESTASLTKTLESCGRAIDAVREQTALHHEAAHHVARPKDKPTNG